MLGKSSDQTEVELARYKSCSYFSINQKIFSQTGIFAGKTSNYVSRANILSSVIAESSGRCLYFNRVFVFVLQTRRKPDALFSSKMQTLTIVSLGSRYVIFVHRAPHLSILCYSGGDFVLVSLGRIEGCLCQEVDSCLC